MAYLPPLNGGRVNATISGNTAGAGSLVSSGTLTLAGGNNITLSQAGNAITISGGLAGSNTFGMSNLGNTSGTTGVISGNGLRFNFAGGNNITLSQSINASSATITISAASQTNQTLGLYGLGNTTQNTSLTLDARSMSLNGLGAMSVGYSGNSIQLSAPPVSSVSATGILSISSNGSTISMGAPAYSAGISNGIGNTSGTSGFATNQLVFAGGNNITLSQATGAGGNTLTISAASQTAQTQSNIQGIIASGSTNNTGNISFANGNGVTFGLSNNTVTASVSVPAGGIALANSQTTYTSGTARLSEGGGAITIASTTGQAFNISVPGTSSIIGTGAISIVRTVSTISIGAPSPGTISNWEPLALQHGVITPKTMGAGSVYFYKLQPQAYINASQLQQLISMSVSSSSNSSHAGVISMGAGIYTANGSTLSLITQSSGTAAYQWTNTSSNSINSLAGLKALTLPININMSPGNYWIGMWSRTSSTNNNWFTASNMVFTNATSSFDGFLLQASNTSQGIQEGVGVYTATSAAIPTSMAMSRISQYDLNANAMPYIVFKNQTW